MRMRLGLLSFLISIGLATPAAAFCRLTTRSPSTSQGGSAGGCTTAGVPLEWRQRCISYTLVPSAALGLDLVAVRDTLEASFGTWMAQRCQGDAERLPIVLGQTEELGRCTHAEYNRFGPNANTVVFVSDWESRGADYVREAYGLTLVWHDPDTGEILDADIQINLNRGEIALCAASGCESSRAIDLQNVLTHEVGHFLGLAHSAEHDATMYGDADFGETSKRTLHPDDAAGICEIYGALTAPPECERADFAPRRGFTAECARPMESTSCAVRSGRAGEGAQATALGVALALLGLASRRSRGARAPGWRGGR